MNASWNLPPSPWVECTDDFERRDGGERWIRNIDPMTWISVLHRMAGFGYMEWETAIVFRYMFAGYGHYPDNDRKDRDVLIIAGDRREELAAMPKERLREWYATNIDGHRNSMETILQAIKGAL